MLIMWHLKRLTFISYRNWYLLILPFASSFLFTFYICSWAGMCMWVWVPTKSRRGYLNPWSWSAGKCQLTHVNARNTQFSARAASTLNSHAISPAHLPHFPRIYQYCNPRLSAPCGNLFLVIRTWPVHHPLLPPLLPFVHVTSLTSSPTSYARFPLSQVLFGFLPYCNRAQRSVDLRSTCMECKPFEKS